MCACSTLLALGGGVAHSPSISDSTGTTRPDSSSSSASRARGFPPGSATAAPAARASSGPSRA